MIYKTSYKEVLTTTGNITNAKITINGALTFKMMNHYTVHLIPILI